MDRLWTPWRYSYITGADTATNDRKGVPESLKDWPGEDQHCVFCNLIHSVEWATNLPARPGAAPSQDSAEEAGLIVGRLETCFICLNAFPYASGHVLIVPYKHLDSLAKLPADDAHEMIQAAQTMETVLRNVYQPDGLNIGVNLGQAAGAGVANHIHMHQLPRWAGDTNFMTVTAETRILPEMLQTTSSRLRDEWRRASK